MRLLLTSILVLFSFIPVLAQEKPVVNPLDKITVGSVITDEINTNMHNAQLESLRQRVNDIEVQNTQLRFNLELCKGILKTLGVDLGQYEIVNKGNGVFELNKKLPPEKKE